MSIFYVHKVGKVAIDAGNNNNQVVTSTNNRGYVYPTGAKGVINGYTYGNKEVVQGGNISGSIKKSLLIGINYKGTPNALNGCINDTINAKTMIVNQYGYSNEYILMLNDNSEIKPTRANILAAFDWLLSGAKASEFKVGARYTSPLPSGSSLYYHYSGHGSSEPDRDRDEADGYDEVIVPIDFQRSGCISDDEIRARLVVKVPLGCRLVSIMDCCHSGTILDLLWNATSRDGSSFQLTKNGNYNPTNGNVIALSGCLDNQTSADTWMNGAACGALSFAFFSVLKDSGYSISHEKLVNQIRSYIKAHSISDQIPCLSFGQNVSLSDGFII